MKTIFLTLLATLSLEISAQWKNNWDSPLNFQCPNKSYISQIVSTHSNSKEDRRFDFNCKPAHNVVGTVSCSLSGYVNNYDEPVLYTCTNGGYLNGVSSVHDNKKEDRRYRFRCCTPVSGHCHKNCRWTGWVNNWDETFNYFVPSGYVIKAVYSVHDNKKETIGVFCIIRGTNQIVYKLAMRNELMFTPLMIERRTVGSDDDVTWTKTSS